MSRHAAGSAAGPYVCMRRVASCRSLGGRPLGIACMRLTSWASCTSSPRPGGSALTLKEIRHIVDLRSAKSGPCVHVRALLEQKLADLDNLRRGVRKILNSWDAFPGTPEVVCE